MEKNKENLAGDIEESVFKTPHKGMDGLKRGLCDTPRTPPNCKRLKSMTIPSSPLLDKLGYGTGVTVFLMHRAQTPSGLLKSPWAVKKLNRRIQCDKSEGELFEERLKIEADMLITLSHENIIGYRASVKGSDGQLCLCMESGEKSLQDLIENRRDSGGGPFSPSHIHQVVYCVSKALSYLHEQRKLLHGDIKSHNILIKGDYSEVKLCDFGVCLRLRDDLLGLADDDDCYVGTGAWSSREALDGGIITDRADIYSLGCVIYEMLTLSVPHLPSVIGEDDSFTEESFDEEEFLDAQGSVPVLPDNINYNSSYHTYMALMSICCRQEAQLRPSASEIVKTLDIISSKQQPDLKSNDS